jgi:hypothetical protein
VLSAGHFWLVLVRFCSAGCGWGRWGQGGAGGAGRWGGGCSVQRAARSGSLPADGARQGGAGRAYGRVALPHCCALTWAGSVAGRAAGAATAAGAGTGREEARGRRGACAVCAQLVGPGPGPGRAVTD